MYIYHHNSSEIFWGRVPLSRPSPLSRGTRLVPYISKHGYASAVYTERCICVDRSACEDRSVRCATAPSSLFSDSDGAYHGDRVVATLADYLIRRLLRRIWWCIALRARAICRRPNDFRSVYMATVYFNAVTWPFPSTSATHPLPQSGAGTCRTHVYSDGPIQCAWITANVRGFKFVASRNLMKWKFQLACWPAVFVCL